MHKSNQKGFALVEILLVVLVVSVLGFGGYYVYNENVKKDETIAVEQNTESIQEQITVSDTNQADNVDEDLFEISELGLFLSKDVIGYDDLAYDVLGDATNTAGVEIGIYSQDLRSRL